MSKAQVCGYFVGAPTVAEALACVSQTQAIAKILRKKKRISNLEPLSAVIAAYLKNTHVSLTVLRRILQNNYGLKVHKSTLWRFIRSRPALSSLRPLRLVETLESAGQGGECA